MKFELVSACAAALVFSLHGCGSSGGGGGGETTTSTSSGPAGPTTTTLNPTPPDPRNGEDIAKMMNDEYNAFDETNESSPIGNWFRYTKDLDNLFYCGTTCYKGKPDCKVSGSVMNYKMMITEQGNPSGWFSYRSQSLAGFYVNSSLVQKMGKCAYAWDGASDAKVNKGCGCSQAEYYDPEKACKKGTKDYNQSAYSNKVPPEFIETSGAESSNVAPCACSAKEEADLPAYGIGDGCFYKGPALDTSRDDNPNEFHKMMKRRVEWQNETRGGYGPSITAWNELNIDGELLNQALMQDPSGTILAFVYSLEPQSGLELAQQMNAKFQKDHKLSKPLPIIMLDTKVDVRTGTASPWIFKPEDQLTQATVV